MHHRHFLSLRGLTLRKTADELDASAVYQGYHPILLAQRIR